MKIDAYDRGMRGVISPQERIKNVCQPSIFVATSRIKSRRLTDSRIAKLNFDPTYRSASVNATMEDTFAGTKSDEGQ